MSINHNVDLNLSASVMPPVLNMAQYDANSHTIIASLWDGTSGFTVPSGSVVMVRFGKPDNTGGLYDKTESGEAITYSGNVVTAPVATQMLSVAGKVQADIEIYQTGETEQASVKLATFCFTVNVEKAAYPDAEIISSDYYNIISGDMSEFRNAQEQIIASQAALEEVSKSIAGNIESAQLAAQTATEKANAAATSAKNAASSESSANNANAAAQTAKTNAESAKAAAENAKTAAQDAQTAAEAAKNGAESAKTEAEEANQSAIAAAEEAQNFATAMQECEPYSSTKSYVVANMVTSGGSTYRCIKPCTGISPPNNTYWLLIAQKGADGLGSGDMVKSVYDPQGKAQDIFSYADGKSAYQSAVGAGYTGTETAFNAALSVVPTHIENSDIHVTAEEKAAWSESDIFIATYGTTTSAEIEAAYQAGKAVYCLDKSTTPIGFYSLTRISTSGHYAYFDVAIGQDLSGIGFGKTVQAICISCTQGTWNTTKYAAATSEHASAHASDGADPITPASIGASPISTITEVTLTAASWAGSASPYTQSVTISGITVNSKVDIQMDATALGVLIDSGTSAIWIENNNGTLTAKAMGEKPNANLSVQVTITEVSA